MKTNTKALPYFVGAAVAAATTAILATAMELSIKKDKKEEAKQWIEIHKDMYKVIDDTTHNEADKAALKEFVDIKVRTKLARASKSTKKFVNTELGYELFKGIEKATKEPKAQKVKIINKRDAKKHCDRKENTDIPREVYYKMEHAPVAILH